MCEENHSKKGLSLTIGHKLSQDVHRTSNSADPPGLSSPGTLAHIGLVADVRAGEAPFQPELLENLDRARTAQQGKD